MCYERRRAEACVDESAHHYAVTHRTQKVLVLVKVIQSRTTNLCVFITAGPMIKLCAGVGPVRNHVL